ncbi:MAG: hypothetical protein IKZ87_00635 [Actinomycetaceae bacterium]|nr:hypothetical protein [Actinomycetaceae bacterium]
MQQYVNGTNVPAPFMSANNAQQVSQSNPRGKAKMSTGAKVAIGLGVSTVVAFVLVVVVILSLIKSIDFNFFGSSVEPHDTPEVQAFISAEKSTERDLEMFDILRPGFEDIYFNRVDEGSIDTDGAGNEIPKQQDTQQRQEAAKAYVTAFRKKVAAGSWPQDDPILGNPTYSESPQLWVRIAELSQDHIQEETGEKWRVLSVPYPLLPSGDIARPKRDPNRPVITSLVCESGDDAGLAVEVSYYRWLDPAYMTSNYKERVAEISTQRDLLAAAQASGLLEGRQVAIGSSHQIIYVWSTGEGDSLRNSEEFTRTLIELSKKTGMEELELQLVERDAPVFIEREFLNLTHRKLISVPVDKAPEVLLLDGCDSDSLGFAPADLLLSQKIKTEENGVGTYGLYGSLVSSGDTAFHWNHAANEEKANEGLSVFVAKQLGVDEEQVLALLEVNSYHSVDVILPRDLLPETPSEVDNAIHNLQHQLWVREFAGKKDDPYSLYLNVFVIDADKITGPDGVADFSALRSAVMKNTSAIESFDAPQLLRVKIGSSAYDHDIDNMEEGWVSEHYEMDGPLADSRAWWLVESEMESDTQGVIVSPRNASARFVGSLEGYRTCGVGCTV